MSMYAVLHELIEGDWQIAVVVAAVVGVLDLDTGEHLSAARLSARKAGDSSISMVRGREWPVHAVCFMPSAPGLA